MAVQEGRVLRFHNAQESEVLRDKKSIGKLHPRSVLIGEIVADAVLDSKAPLSEMGLGRLLRAALS
jgi:hypothetical protein